MPNKSRSEWEQMVPNLKIPHQAIIDGQSVDSASGETFDCISPIDGKKLASVARCGTEDVERAVAAARKAFESGVWANMPPAVRKKVLQRFAMMIADHAEELALLETLDMGKPIGDSLAIDVAGTVRCIDWNADDC